MASSQPLDLASITADSSVLGPVWDTGENVSTPCEVRISGHQEVLPHGFTLLCPYDNAFGNTITVSATAALTKQVASTVVEKLILPASIGEPDGNSDSESSDDGDEGDEGGGSDGGGFGGYVSSTYLWNPPPPSSADTNFTLALRSSAPLASCVVYAVTDQAFIASLVPSTGIADPRSSSLASAVTGAPGGITAVYNDFCGIGTWVNSTEPFQFPEYTIDVMQEFSEVQQAGGRVLFSVSASSTTGPSPALSYTWLWHATAVTMKQLPWPVPDAIVPPLFVQQLSQGFSFGFRGYPVRFTASGFGPKHGGMGCTCAVVGGVECEVVDSAITPPPLPPGASPVTMAAWRHQVDVFVEAVRPSLTPPTVSLLLECSVYGGGTPPFSQQTPLSTTSRSLVIHRSSLPEVASFTVVPSSYVIVDSNGSVSITSPVQQASAAAARELATHPTGSRHEAVPFAMTLSSTRGPTPPKPRRLALAPLFSMREGGIPGPSEANFMTLGGNSSIILTAPPDSPFNPLYPPAITIAGLNAAVEVSADGTVAVVTPPSYDDVCGPALEGSLTACDLENIYHTMTLRMTEPTTDTLYPTLICPPDCPPMAFDNDPATGNVKQLAKTWYSRAARGSYAPIGFSATAGTGVYYTQVCVGFASDQSICLDPDRAHECAFGIGDGCRPCPIGCMCPGGPRCFTYQGWWVSNETVGTPVRCSPPASTRCVGWNLDTGRTQCGEGYRQNSYGCSLCANGFYPDDSGACVLCPDLSVSLEPVLLPLGVLLGSAAVLFALTYITVLIMARIAGGTVAGGLRRAKDFLVSVFITLQVLVTAAQDFPPATPGFLRSLLSGLSFFHFDFSFPGLHVDCMSDSPFAVHYIILSVVLVVVLALFCIEWLMVKAAAPARRLPAGLHSGFVDRRSRRTTKTPQSGSSGASGFNELRNPSVSIASQVRRPPSEVPRSISKKQGFAATVMSLLVLVVSLAYPQATKMALSVLKCHSIPNASGGMSYVMASNAAVTCFEGSHTVAAVLSILVLLCVTLSYPLYVLWRLRRYARKAPFPQGRTPPVAALSESDQKQVQSTATLTPEEGSGLWLPSPSPLHLKAWAHVLDNEEWPSMFWVRAVRLLVIAALSIIIAFLTTPPYSTDLPTLIAGTILTVLVILPYVMTAVYFNPYTPMFSWRRPVLLMTEVTACCVVLLRCLAAAVEYEAAGSAACSRGNCPTTPLETLVQVWSFVTFIMMAAVFIVLFLAFFLSVARGARVEQRLNDIAAAASIGTSGRKRQRVSMRLNSFWWLAPVLSTKDKSIARAITQEATSQLMPPPSPSPRSSPASVLSSASETERKATHMPLLELSRTSRAAPRNTETKDVIAGGTPGVRSTSPAALPLGTASPKRSKHRRRRSTMRRPSFSGASSQVYMNPLRNSSRRRSHSGRRHRKSRQSLSPASSPDTLPAHSAGGFDSTMTTALTDTTTPVAFTQENPMYCSPAPALPGSMPPSSQTEKSHADPRVPLEMDLSTVQYYHNPLSQPPSDVTGAAVTLGPRSKALKASRRSPRAAQKPTASDTPGTAFAERLSELKQQLNQFTANTTVDNVDEVAQLLQQEFGGSGVHPGARNGWVELYDASSQCPYYYHCVTKEAQWERPKRWVANVVAMFNVTHGSRG